MSSNQSSFYVLESKNDIESLNERISTITTKEEKQPEEKSTIDVKDLANQISEKTEASLREIASLLNLQGNYGLNSSLNEEIHNIKYSPLNSLQSSSDSIESETEKLDEFWDFDEKLGLGVEVRLTRAGKLTILLYALILPKIDDAKSEKRSFA